MEQWTKPIIHHPTWEPLTNIILIYELLWTWVADSASSTLFLSGSKSHIIHSIGSNQYNLKEWRHCFPFKFASLESNAPPLTFERRAIANSPLRLLMHFNSFNLPILLSLEFRLLSQHRTMIRVWSMVNSPNPHGIKVNPLFPSISRSLKLIKFFIFFGNSLRYKHWKSFNVCKCFSFVIALRSTSNLL